MTTEVRLDRLCELALDEWGEEAQRNMVMEELGELIAAINQYHRGRVSRESLAEEMADVHICLRQLEMMVGGEVTEEQLEKSMQDLYEDLTDD